MEQERTELHICITEGASNTARLLLYQIARADLFKKKHILKLYLTDVKQNLDTLDRIVKEFQLGGISLMKSISFLNIKDAFEIADILILLHPERGRCWPDPYQYLQPYVEIFKDHGLALALFAKPTARVVVAGDMANTHARVLLEYAKEFPPANISVVTRLHANYGRAVLAEKLEVPTSRVRDVLVTGNCTGVQNIDAMQARLVDDAGENGVSERVAVTLAHDHHWLRKDFVKLTKAASVATVNVHLPQNGLSMANAIFEHVRELWHGTPVGRTSSAGIYLDRALAGMQPGIFISLPVCARDRCWRFDTNLIGEMGCMKTQLKDAAAQLHAEATTAIKILAERKYAKENPSVLNVSDIFRWLDDLIEKATLSREEIPSIEEFADKYLGSLEDKVDGEKSLEFDKVNSSESIGSPESLTVARVQENGEQSASRGDDSLKLVTKEESKGLVNSKRSGSIVTSRERYRESGELVVKSRPSVTIVEDRMEKTLQEANSPDHRASKELMSRLSKIDSEENSETRGSVEAVYRRPSLKVTQSGTVEGKKASAESAKRNLSLKIVDSKEQPVSTSAEKLPRGSKESVKNASKTSLKRESGGSLDK